MLLRIGYVADPVSDGSRATSSVGYEQKNFRKVKRLRTREGMRVAKAKGRLRGKQPKLIRRQEAHLVCLVHSGEYSTAEVAKVFGLGRSTVYRAIERKRLDAEAGLAETRDEALNTSLQALLVSARSRYAAIS